MKTPLLFYIPSAPFISSVLYSVTVLFSPYSSLLPQRPLQFSLPESKLALTLVLL
jgi:hypothetical protein